MLDIFYDHGHLASTHLNHRSLGLASSAKQSWLLPLCGLNPQHCSFLSRIKASPLYVGMAYLGCCINCTFFHHNFIAWRMNEHNVLSKCQKQNQLKT